MTTEKNKQLSFLKIPLLLLGIVILLSFSVNAASAANTTQNTSQIYVSTQGNDTWDGLSATYNSTSESGPKATINNATGTVATNGTVYIASGTYNEQGMNIETNMTIIGSNQQNTIINGTQSGPIFNIAPGVNVTISNLTLTNGNNPNGGAIYNNGTLTITNCTFTGNNAQNGGAIYNDATINVTDTTLTGITIPANGGTLTIINSTFTNNTATGNGGAIYNGGLITINTSTLTGSTATYNGGILTVTSSKFKGNTALNGGAIYNDATIIISDLSTLTNSIATYNGGTLTINNSTLTSNNATGNGGAIYNGGMITITNSTLTGSTAQNGGILSVNNSTIIGNQAVNGGAIYNEALITVANSTLTDSTAQNGGTFTVTNSTLVSNAATQNGGGLDNEANINVTNNTFTTNTVANGGGNLTITNSSITSNTAPNGAAIYNNALIIDLNNSGANTVANGGTVTATPNWWGSNLGPAAGNISGNENVTVTPWLEAPTITSVDPSNGAINVSTNQVITVTFNEPIKNGTGDINLKDNSGNSVPFTSSISGDVLTITPTTTLAEGTPYGLELHTGSITNLAGLPIAYYYTRFTTGPLFTITSTNPSNGAINVSTNQVITVTFNEPIKNGTGDINLKDNSGNSVPFTSSISGDVLTITPAVMLAEGMPYGLELHTGSITNLAGLPIAYYYTRFTTGPLFTITSTNPSNGAINVSTNQVITVTFNEPIKNGTGAISLKDNSGNSVPFTSSISGDVLTITPTVMLAEGMPYGLELHTGSITNLAGLSIAYYYTTFNTTDV